MGYQEIALALECPKAPEQIQKDLDVDVNVAVAKIGPVSGGELKTKTRSAAQDLIGKLPNADKVYLEHMMLATYCSALRDDKSLSEIQKSERIKDYNAEVRKALHTPPEVKQSTGAPQSERLNKGKENRTRSQVIPPVTPLPQADSKQSEAQNKIRTELDEAKSQIAALKTQLASREITEDQKARLISKLRGKDEGRIITVKTVDGVPPEGFKYAEDFIYVFITAGWTFDRFWGWWFLPIENVAVRAHPYDPVAVFIQSVLREEGIKARLIETPEVKANNIDIVIGPKG